MILCLRQLETIPRILLKNSFTKSLSNKCTKAALVNLWWPVLKKLCTSGHCLPSMSDGIAQAVISCGHEQDWRISWIYLGSH